MGTLHQSPDSRADEKELRSPASIHPGTERANGRESDILAYYVYSQIRAGWKDLQKRGGIFARNSGPFARRQGFI
jgi:hypothetical protein